VRPRPQFRLRPVQRPLRDSRVGRRRVQVRRPPRPPAALAAHVLRIALPLTLALLAEVLADRLGGQCAAGAAGALTALGPRVVPALVCVLLRGRGPRGLAGLAAVLAGLGDALVEPARTDLLGNLALALYAAPDDESRAALLEACDRQRDDPAAPSGWSENARSQATRFPASLPQRSADPRRPARAE
jgi:hypothetical protein